MLEEGVYFAPSQFEAGFTSLAHSSVDIQQTVEAAEKVFRQTLKAWYLALVLPFLPLWQGWSFQAIVTFF